MKQSEVPELPQIPVAVIGGATLIPSVQQPTPKLWCLGSQIQWATVDGIAAFASMYCAFYLSPASGNIAEVATHASAPLASVICAITAFLASYVLGLAHYPNLRSTWRIVVLTFALVAVSIGGTQLVISLIFYKQIGRYIVAICALLALIVVTGSRLAWYRRLRLSRYRLAVLGDACFLSHIEGMVKHSIFPIEVYSKVELSTTAWPTLEGLIASHNIDEVVVQNISLESDSRLLTALDCGVAVSIGSSFTERFFFRVPVGFLTSDWFFQVDFKQHSSFYFPVKRLLDVVGSVVGLVIFAPVLSVLLLLIRVESRGAGLYSQMRVGLRQKPFRIWKLRTMRIDSESNGPKWAAKRDPRVTLMGVFLRKSRLDELPQLWNILKGEMTFVGPRPERPEFVEQLAKVIPYYSQRHLMKPGLTGWAQICFPYGASEADAREKLSYDLYYVKNASFLLDVQILLQTLGAVARGAR